MAGQLSPRGPGAPTPLRARGVLDAAREVADALGWRWESLTGLKRDGDTWAVTVDVVETRKVPPTTDLIAIYEMELDSGGELLGFRRRRHYVRGQGDRGESGRS